MINGIKNFEFFSWSGLLWFALTLLIFSVVYALWESLFCVAFIVALMGISQAKFNTQNKLMQFLSASTFGVYVFHAPILIGLSVLIKDIHIEVITKFFLVGVCAFFCSLLFAWMVKQISYIEKIFN